MAPSGRRAAAHTLLILACIPFAATCAGSAEEPATTIELTETPYEEFMARRPVAPSGTPRPGDPEYPRVFPPDGEETPAGGVGHRRHAPPPARSGDPEYPRHWPDDGAALLVQDPSIGRLAGRQSVLPPRFVLGEGPDKGDTADWTDESDLPPAAALTPAQGEPGVEELQTEPQPHRQNPKRSAQELLAAEAEAHVRKKGIDLTRSEELAAHSTLSALRGNRPLTEINGTVIDAETNEPVPARVRIVDATHTPAEARLPNVGFWCNGRFRVPVVAGNVLVEVSAGRFSTIYSNNIMVSAGASTSIEIPLLRPRFLRFEREGWYLADLDWAVRARRGEQLLWTGTPPELSDAALAARAEGVQIVGIGLPESRTDLAVRSPEKILAENATYGLQGLLVMTNFPGPRHSFCGSVMGIGVTEWEGIPRYMGDPRQPLSDCLDALRQGGGLTLFGELRGGRAVKVRTQLAGYFERLRRQGFFEDGDTTALLYAPAELPCATVTGPAYDALAFDGSDAAEGIWFNLLNQGYTIPIVGSEGGSLESGRPPFGQTLVRVPDQLTREAVLKSCREGRSMVSFGPVVFADVTERARGPGDRLPADGRQLSIRVRGFSSLTPGASLEGFDIIRNGEVILHEKCEQGMTELYDFRFPLTEKRDAWYVVRMTEVLHKPNVSRRRAWTNPIYFDTPSRPKPEPARTRVHGTLRRAGGAPLAGSISVIEPGEPDREYPIGLDGRFDLHLRSCGTLVFGAPGFDPVAWKPIQHPNVQRALGAIQTERGGLMRRQLVRPTLFSEWRYLLAELSTDIELSPRAASRPQDRQTDTDSDGTGPARPDPERQP